MPSVIIHLNNEDPVLGEIDALPSPTDYLIIVKNPRKRDGKDLHYIEANVTTVIWPVSRINFIEVLPAAEEEEVISFVRE
ncbi:MAG: hypothetical protein ACPLUL_10455 [Thermanaerothrix sp.]|jgi:hypothetical protein|uniref:Uncharacterized protein n=1 Tax=Thermanaerothrix solaris TaxID=3058434 RepID=A0ABU3NKA8_9CHLR|nr:MULTISPECIES: hypothetical protein [unclassified Thermanaerothrix]MDT8897262.1 hypothetical protein [Thermanaerothrix sp. 4228-RoL]